jgi:hypothetical protein
MQLQLAGETHGDGEGLWVVDLDVEVEGRLQAGGEELHFLGLRECTDAMKQGLKLVLVLDDRARESTRHEFVEQVGVQWRPKAGIELLGEAPPWWHALVALNLHEPQLGTGLQVVWCHPYFFLFRDALLVKVGLAPIDENQGIGFPVKLGKIHLLETRWAVVVVLATMHPSSARWGGVGGAVSELVELGLQGPDGCGQLGDESHEVGYHQFGHG